MDKGLWAKGPRVTLGTDRARLWADLAALAPALLFAAVWLGPEGALVAALAALPFVILRRAPDRTTRGGPPTSATDFRDTVSGLPMRAAAVLALDQALAETARTGRTTACIAVCLDEPGQLIERYGQSAHDRILRSLAERMVVVLRQNDVVARLEGDRFAIALGALRRADLEMLIQLCARLQTAIQEPLSIDAMSIYLSASVGFCLPGRAPAQTGEAMLNAAEAALDDAWRNGPSAIRAFSPEVAQAAANRLVLQDRIEQALERGEIVAHFQPQLSTDTGEVTGFESLARWNHPDHGVLPPSEFLPIIMASGLSSRLGEVILFQCLNALRHWDRAGYAIPTVAANFCKEELRNPRLTEKLQWELDRFDLAAGRVTVEILETVVAETDNDTVVHNIAALAAMGCGIDLDDFGTGHASITSIRRFAVKRIKIDRSFVTRVDSDPAQQKMIAAILSMAERLGLETLAEGVETAGEHAMLAQLGCNHVQGYAIARPMPFDETIAWLERHRNKVAPAPTLGRKRG